MNDQIRQSIKRWLANRGVYNKDWVPLKMLYHTGYHLAYSDRGADPRKHIGEEVKWKTIQTDYKECGVETDGLFKINDWLSINKIAFIDPLVKFVVRIENGVYPHTTHEHSTDLNTGSLLHIIWFRRNESISLIKEYRRLPSKMFYPKPSDSLQGELHAAARKMSLQEAWTIMHEISESALLETHPKVPIARTKFGKGVALLEKELRREYKEYAVLYDYFGKKCRRIGGSFEGGK